MSPQLESEHVCTVLQLPNNNYVSDGRKFFLDLDVSKKLPELLPAASPVESTKVVAIEKKWKIVHSRVKTGCATCRQRRVKCGEERPSCVQCTKGGRSCPGYQKPKVCLFEPIKDYEYPSPPPLVPLSTSPFNDAPGWRAFQYYFGVSAPALARHFASATTPFFQDRIHLNDPIAVASMFWTVTFPRLVCSEPVLARCLMVLVTAHEKLRSAKSLLASEPQTLERFVEAFTLLQRQWSNISVDSILIASLLFSIAELSSGPSQAGRSHLFAGGKIISQRRLHPDMYAHHPSSLNIEGLRETVELFYETVFARARPEWSAMISTDRSHPKMTAIPKFWFPPKFTTTQEALGSLETIVMTAQAMRHRDFGRAVHSDYVGLRHNAERWLMMFEGLETELNHKGDSEIREACLVIRINGLVNLIICSSLSSQMHYDRYEAEFRQIVELAEELLNTGRGMTESVKEHLVFGLGPVNPVFFAATKCRYSVVRQRLMQALRRLKAAQGLWTSCAAYQIASRLARVEDAMNDGEAEPKIMASSGRISLDSVIFHRADQITLRYFQELSSGEKIKFTETFWIQPCRHQTFLNMGEVRINEFGIVPGFVRPADCDCEQLYRY